MDAGFVLTGTREAEPPVRMLRAGPLTVEMVNGNLRAIRHNGVEVARAIAYIVRDRDWGTYDPEIHSLAIDERSDGFRVTYEGVCAGPGGATLRFTVRIDGGPNGALIFDVTARPDADFETNRCGFCILHPIAGLAGAPVTVEHVDGSVLKTTLPDLIDPWQPFKGMRAITTPVAPGIVAECRMEGDTFEMEDQRNWSDASYKTYVRPLALPWPYILKAGETVQQTVSLTFRADGSMALQPARSAPRQQTKPIRVGLGAEGPALPAIGIVVYPQDAEASLAQVETLRLVAPQRLLFHFDPLAGHGLLALQGFAALATTLPAQTTLEVALPCRRNLDAELSEIAGLVATAGLKPDALMVSPSVDRQSTPPGSKWPECPPLDEVYAAARRAFPGIRLGGGMLSYFTELNRKRVPAGLLDFVSHCTCPIVHAADDFSLMQTLEALPFITRSVRAIYGDLPYRIGPSTIAMRQNPYGGRTMDNPALSRIAMANRDPRHSALFAAAWAVGYAARTAAAGLDQLVLSSLTGPFGLIAGADEPFGAGGRRPLFHVVRSLGRLAGARSWIVTSGRDGTVACLAAEHGNGLAVLAANLTPSPITVDCNSLTGVGLGAARVLDGDAVAAQGGFVERPLQAGVVELGPYAVAALGSPL